MKRYTRNLEKKALLFTATVKINQNRLFLVETIVSESVQNQSVVTIYGSPNLATFSKIL